MTPKLKAYAISILRYAFMRAKQHTAALQEARIKRGLYSCAICRGEFKRTQVNVDHIDEIMLVCQPFSFDCFIERLFDGPLQVLCKECHQSKTNKAFGDKQ